MLDHASTGWTEHRTEMLRNMWTAGASASEIANALGGTTRNAVIGKINRLKLPTRRMQGRDMDHAQRRAAEARAPRPKLDPEPEIRTDAWSPLPGTNPVALEHVTGCRWPIGDPLSPDFCMCNAQRVEGSSYCRDHKRLSEPKR